ncbi:hypothetical protein NIES4102_03010 [Chondrocystis sp. NIES-4102]|nr:hypothetical protein NIES4102_03010 [Chondrocystis sp. NIES-4102]
MTNLTCVVIGGGISGLITATVLQRAGIKVTVLDKGRGIGGRLATRRLEYGESCIGIFDYGAQYFSIKQPQLQVWVDDWLQQGVIKEWCRGFDEVDGKPRYCGVNGIRSIAKYLAQNLNVHTNTKVIKLNYQDGWQVLTEDGQFTADILVMTPPVPQSLTLLDDSQITLSTETRENLEAITYHSCIAILALLEQPCKIPAPGGMSLETEPLVWLASNDQKGISPNGYAVTLHATPNFSKTYWSKGDEEIAQMLLDSAAKWLDSPVIKYQVHRWRYSLPATFHSQPYLALSELPLVMAGDAFVAPKIEGAVLSGLAAAEYIISQQ